MKAVQKKYLILNTPEEKNIVCKPDKAVEKYAELTDIDLIFICVKGYDLAGTIKDIAANSKKSAYIIPLLNGVDIYERVREDLDHGIVFPACVYISSAIEQSGTVTQSGGDGIIILGKDPRHPEIVPVDLLTLFDESGIQYNWLDDVFPIIWEKFIFIAGFGIYTAYSGKVFGEVMADETAKHEVRSIMEEIYELSKSAGITLSETIVEDSLNRANNFPFNTKTSYQRDVERKAPNNEGELFGGAIIKMGNKYHIPTETTERLYSAIRAKL